MIPGSFVDEATKRIRWRRLEDCQAGRVYDAQVPDGWLRAIVSQDPCQDGTFWHISVSHRSKDNQPDRCPTWDELKHAKFTLLTVDVPMILIFPTKTAPYVNHHPTTLHLWEAEEGIDQ